ncbi:MAG: hypothetical protein DSY91_03285 [Deltaproteobacteria bacterium]|nr:MAG: hypothetical protein DSY91_03285 [Deltaproteobacteria bacterium]
MTTFADIAIVACGVMSLELRALQDEGFLDTKNVLYTTPGLHQDPFELERQLFAQVKKAKEKADKVLVVYGGKFCYVNTKDPTRTMKILMRELQPGVERINATHCMDMIASEEERDRIAQEVAGGESVWWMTPGWIKYRNQVFKGMDKVRANENFGRHSLAIVLDAVGYTEKYMEEKPEEFLDYSDWMGLPIQPYPVTLDRFKTLLTEAAEKLVKSGS